MPLEALAGHPYTYTVSDNPPYVLHRELVRLDQDGDEGRRYNAANAAALSSVGER